MVSTSFSTAPHDRQYCPLDGQKDIEKEAQQALVRVRPDLVSTFDEQLRVAKVNALGRLWGSLYREKTLCLGATSSSSGSLLLPNEHILSAPVTDGVSFGPYTDDFSVTLSNKGIKRLIRDPVELLAAIPFTPGQHVARLTDEVANSVANLALALTARRDRQDQFGSLPDWETGKHNIFAWAFQRAKTSVSFSPLAFFEQAVVFGHPLHPCHKTRLGMSMTDVLHYSPEWAQVIPVAVVAVRKGRYQSGSMEGLDLTELLCADHPELLAETATLSTPRDYALLPVHPWQLATVLMDRYREDFDSGDVVTLSAPTVTGRPLLSFRTIASAADRRASHFKTAINLQMTSAVRIVSPAYVHNGPLLSSLLNEVMRREQYFCGRFTILSDLATGCYVDPIAGPAAGLAAAARVSPEQNPLSGEIVLPAAALSAHSPFSGRSIVVDAVRSSQPQEWLAAYCECVIPPTLTLLTRWGIALEAHGQNTLIGLRDGWPIRVFYRDMGGVRISQRRLHQQGIDCPPLLGDIATDDVDELRTKLFASLVSTHVSELIATLAAHYDISPEQLWVIVARSAHDTFSNLSDEWACLADSRALFADVLPMKAMMSMRLATDSLAEQWVAVPNPLNET